MKLPFISTFLAALALLTRFPVPGRSGRDAVAAGRATGFFPLVGLLLGACQAGLVIAIQRWLPEAPPLITAVFLLAVHVFLTGALHLDGAADLADGLGGSHGDRARALAIMRDTQVGAFGATVIVLILLGKAAAVAAWVERPEAPMALLFMPVAARFLVVPAIIWVPAAREQGMGRAAREGCGPLEVLWALAWTAAACALAAAWFGIAAAMQALIAPCAAALGAAALVMLWAWRRLGGLTGDVYGAMIEAAETAFLIGAALKYYNA